MSCVNLRSMEVSDFENWSSFIGLVGKTNYLSLCLGQDVCGLLLLILNTVFKEGVEDQGYRGVLSKLGCN